MKIGLFAMNYGTCADPQNAIKVARHAESVGLESLWTGEHVVLPSPQGAGLRLPPTLPFLDTIVSLTLLAAETSTIKAASGVILAAERNPVILADELASVDVVSGGRLTVGVGVGYVEEEFDALGVAMSELGARVDDYLG